MEKKLKKKKIFFSIFFSFQNFFFNFFKCPIISTVHKFEWVKKILATLQGTFKGLNARGALELETQNGVRTIDAGDVYIAANEGTS